MVNQQVNWWTFHWKHQFQWIENCRKHQYIHKIESGSTSTFPCSLVYLKGLGWAIGADRKFAVEFGQNVFLSKNFSQVRRAWVKCTSETQKNSTNHRLCFCQGGSSWCRIYKDRVKSKSRVQLLVFCSCVNCFGFWLVWNRFTHLQQNPREWVERCWPLGSECFIRVTKGHSLETWQVCKCDAFCAYWPFSAIRRA